MWGYPEVFDGIDGWDHRYGRQRKGRKMREKGKEKLRFTRLSGRVEGRRHIQNTYLRCLIMQIVK